MDDRVRGRDIIAQVIENMRSQGEELRYSTVVPAAYDVYLHPTDHARLESLAGAIADEARRALDEELARLNRASALVTRVRGALRRPRLPHVRAGSTWEIRLLSDPNDELEPGDIVVDSTLVVPESESLSGSRTRRIVTARQGGRLESREMPAPAGREGAPPADAPGRPTSSESSAAPRPLATLTYRDETGEHVFRMDKPQVVVGRGGPGYWVDLQLRTVPDVSRDHLRLRYDEPERRFHIKDLSTLGTTVNGVPIPSSIEVRDGQKVDRNVEVPLPAEAEIGLAGAVFLRFRAEIAT